MGLRALAIVAAAILRRVVLLAGWALVVYVVWVGVPFVALNALGRLEEVSTAAGGEVARRALDLAGLLLLAGVPALLAWYLLLVSGGRTQAAAVLATLVSLAYAASAPVPPTAAPPAGDFAAALLALRGASYAFLSLLLSWLFVFALGSILLLAEPVSAAAEEAALTT